VARHLFSLFPISFWIWLCENLTATSVLENCIGARETTPSKRISHNCHGNDAGDGNGIVAGKGRDGLERVELNKE
jgi:hypothetical protein